MHFPEGVKPAKYRNVGLLLPLCSAAVATLVVKGQRSFVSHFEVQAQRNEKLSSEVKSACKVKWKSVRNEIKALKLQIRNIVIVEQTRIGHTQVIKKCSRV